MAQTVRLDDDFIADVKIHASAAHRSLPKQIEYWAKVGRAALDNPDLPVSFDLAESVDVARFLKSVRVFTFAESLGGVESLVTCPSVQTHADVPVEVRASYGLSALRWEKRSARTPADSDLYRADRGRVRSLRARLRPTDRVRCAVLSLIRHAEVFVYDRTVHRRR